MYYITLHPVCVCAAGWESVIERRDQDGNE